MSAFLDDLKRELSSETKVDTISKVLYSTDASIYEVEPIAIVIPRTKADLIKAIQIANRHKVSVIPRGAATGITGGCLGKGLVIDTSVHLNAIRSIDYDKERVICEPGVIQDQLNAALSHQGYRLGPDTSTGNRATIGGMVGNNAAGAHALKFGQMVDHLEACELILYSGQVIRFEHVTKVVWDEKCALHTQEGEIYRTVSAIQNEYAEEIEKRFPKVIRRVSGYNLNELVKPNFTNIAKLIAGSEGTLGFISEVTLKICKKPKEKAIVLIASKDMQKGLQCATRYQSFKPYALELIDKKIIEAGRLSPAMQGKLSFLNGQPDALFVVEFEAENSAALQEKCAQFHNAVHHDAHIAYLTIIIDEPTQEAIWQLRKAGLGLLLSKRSYNRAIAFIEDIAIPTDKLASFVDSFISYLRSQGKEAGIYGHIGDGCLHIRPYINLTKQDELALMQKIMLDVADMVIQYGGALSAEHGDGLIRTWTNPKMFGEKIYEAFIKLKKAFDPDCLMNPNKIVSSTPFQTFLETDLRLSPQTKIVPQKTFFDFKREGGLELAADLCNGNGQCRKRAHGEGPHVMCPSFQVTGEEKDSTRARANVFRSLVHGKIKAADLPKAEIAEVMDLCIQCKGCKTECPSQVDMAKMKAEYLYQVHSREGYPLRSYLFGYLGSLLKLGSYFPKLNNFLISSAPVKALFSFIGISPKRTLPHLSCKPFSQNYKKACEKPKKIVLFSDTFTEFTMPQLGEKAAFVLEKLGYEVIVPSWSCCGRTMISKGLLPEAKKKAAKLINILYPFAEAGIPICGIEPSCILTIRDEFRDFYLDAKKVDCVISMTKTLDELLYDELPQLTPLLQPFSKEIYVHGHCHQKALVGMKPTLQILHSIPGAKVQEIQSGCCAWQALSAMKKSIMTSQ